ncbi:uncharacterized protein LOC120199219 [Hibiscus syriacus]|uniref:uncharacterized protein LOC120199219 n=1 Tax=Hibiscus syriacus TaxID=106335 RepID=UPI001920FAE1|nr:uncharacterized protein LOC120199219 [Hibiscus syriacus]
MAQHLFIFCHVSWELWTKLIGYWGIQLALPQDPPNLLSLWADLRPNSAIWKFIPGAVFWSIWKLRNEIIFEKGKLDRILLFFTVRLRLAKWFIAKYPLCSIRVDSLIGDPSLADKFSASKVPNSMVYCWNPPPVDFFKMNEDGAVCCVGMMAGMRNSQGLESEWVSKGRLIIESDSKLAVDWINSQVSVPLFLSNLVKEIVTSVSLKQAIVRWIPRSYNCEADKLAKEGIG